MVKPQVKYPVNWTSRVIAEAAAADCEAEIRSVLAGFGLAPEIQLSDRSRTGKYVTYVFTVTLTGKPMMIDLFTKISRIEGVKFAL